MGRLSPGVGGARGGKTENKRAGQQSQEHGLHWSQEVRLEAHGSTLGVRPGRGPGNAVETSLPFLPILLGAGSGKGGEVKGRRELQTHCEGE